MQQRAAPRRREEPLVCLERAAAVALTLSVVDISGGGVWLTSGVNIKGAAARVLRIISHIRFLLLGRPLLLLWQCSASLLSFEITMREIKTASKCQKKLVVAANSHRRTYLGCLRLTQVSCWSIFFVLVVACWPEYFYNSLGVHRFGKDTKRISSAKSIGHMRLSTSCSQILAYAVKGSSRYISKQSNRLSHILKTCTLPREANIGDSRKTFGLGLPSALCI